MFIEIKDIFRKFNPVAAGNLDVLRIVRGKTTGDLSRTGYDYSLLRECLARGITDVRELAAVLALRPGGSVKDGSKGEQYIRATIAKVIKDCEWGKA